MNSSICHFAFAGLFLTASFFSSVRGDGRSDNNVDSVRPVPPIPEIELSRDDRNLLAEGYRSLYQKIAELSKDESLNNWIPDVEIFARAIRDAVEHNELFSKRDIENAKEVLGEGFRRVTALEKHAPYWASQTGLVVRGFRSNIDKTVQPYGLVIPDNYSVRGTDSVRLDIWLHGRGERSSESVFIAERMQQVGRFAPADTIVLHPYGRYSNAFKFAGETDILEALDHAKQNYRVDDDRIAMRGFSMGGAGCWQMAVHFPDMFFAANPGAGFSETPEFLKFFQKETLTPTWFEKKLWQMYDCPGYAINLGQLPTIAYSGELDIQKQAADVMETALDKEQIHLTHIIGAQTQHSIDDASKVIIERKLSQLARNGRNRVPQEVHFATYTLKYNRCNWITITRMREHWKQARIDARFDVAASTIQM
ncbi:MAG: prolyl oligopeptidase family serine peptidase [Planctomycetales bacterium]|nr:prolyl oligopeptidase family serine peptidase [Planctomycetales bacterium]